MKTFKQIFIILIVFLNFSSFSQSTWTGNTDKYWNVASNWDTGTIPTSITNVIIPASPTNNLMKFGSNTAECNNLTINAGAQLSVRPNEALHIYGNLILKTPNNNGPTGSLIEKGSMTVDGTVTFERYYSVNNSWQHICSPLKNINSDLFTKSSAPYFNPNFLRYNQAYDCNPDPNGTYADWSNTNLVNAWEYHHGGESGSAQNLEVGIGYTFASEGNIIINYSGNTNSVINNNNLEIPVTFNSNDGNSDYYDGWNLVGNPYTSAIRWGRRSNDGDDKINNTAYCWDATSSQYKYINGIGGTETGDGSNVVNGSTEYIAAGQGFFVKATETGNFTLLESIRKHNSQNLWKNKSSKTKKQNSYPKELPQYIKLRIEDNGYSDETVIRFIDDATSEFDGEYDAYKISGSNNDVPVIYTASEDFKTITAINSLPYPEDGIKSIPLCIKTNEAKQYTIFLKQSEYSNLNIFLKDNYENKLINLRKFNSYTFNFVGGLNEDRFRILYKPNSSDIVKQEQNNTLIYPNPSNGKVFIETIEQAVSINIFDITGKNIKTIYNPLLKTEFNTSGNNKGVYFIKINFKNNSVNKKIIIK